MDLLMRLALVLAVVTSSAACKRTPPTSPAQVPPLTAAPAPAAPIGPEPVITGTLIDNFGHPIEGATLSIRDSAFRATTDAQGAFSLAYAPGAFRVTAEAPGCLPHSRDLQVTQAVRYPLGPTMLLRVPDISRETVVVATDDGYRPFPSVQLDRRVVNFGSVYAAFPGRCGVFSLQHPVPTLRGTALLMVSPDTHFKLVRVEGQHVTTDPYPGSVGECPGVPQGAHVVDAGSGAMPERTFFLANRLTSGTYCFVRSPRVHPEAPGSTLGYCFEWQVDPQGRFGAAMTLPLGAAPPEALPPDIDDHGA